MSIIADIAEGLTGSAAWRTNVSCQCFAHDVPKPILPGTPVSKASTASGKVYYFETGPDTGCDYTNLRLGRLHALGMLTLDSQVWDEEDPETIRQVLSPNAFFAKIRGFVTGSTLPTQAKLLTLAQDLSEIEKVESGYVGSNTGNFEKSTKCADIHISSDMTWEKLEELLQKRETEMRSSA